VKRGGPLRPVGARGKRLRAGMDSARRVVKERSAGWCEVWQSWADAPRTSADGPFPHTDRLLCASGMPHLGVHAHHVWPEDRDRGVHDPARIVWVCADAHRTIHENPARAQELGWFRTTPPLISTAPESRGRTEGEF
jgi:hypothetical protein